MNWELLQLTVLFLSGIHTGQLERYVSSYYGDVVNKRHLLKVAEQEDRKLPLR